MIVPESAYASTYSSSTIRLTFEFCAKFRGENVAIELKDFFGLGKLFEAVPPVGIFDVLLLGESNLLTAAADSSFSLLMKAFSLLIMNCYWCALKSVVITYGHS